MGNQMLHNFGSFVSQPERNGGQYGQKKVGPHSLQSKVEKDPKKNIQKNKVDITEELSLRR